jgi:hypothetical protein
MAYEIGKLVEKLKVVGLDVAEDGAKKAVVEVFAWVEESAKESSIPYDDLALIVLPKVKDFVIEQLDKIDGKVEA